MKELVSRKAALDCLDAVMKCTEKMLEFEKEVKDLLMKAQVFGIEEEGTGERCS